MSILMYIFCNQRLGIFEKNVLIIIIIVVVVVFVVIGVIIIIIIIIIIINWNEMFLVRLLFLMKWIFFVIKTKCFLIQRNCK